MRTREPAPWPEHAAIAGHEPPPAAVERAFRAASPGAYLLVGLRRGASHLVVGLQKP